MSTLQIQLDDELMEHLRHIAQVRAVSVEALVRTALEATRLPTTSNSLLRYDFS